MELNVIALVGSIISYLIPGFSQIYLSIIKKDMDATMESIPIVVTLSTSAVKLINHRIHKKNFDRLFDLIKEEWHLEKHKNHATILDEITKEGNILGGSYRTILFTFMLIFLFLPLFPLVLDIIIPLNETRPRQQLFKMHYFIDEDQYFYPIYFHSAWCSFVIVTIIVTIDSLYMLIFYHASALFAICGYRIVKVTESINEGLDGTLMEQIKQCVIMHNKALQFFEIMDDCSCNSYFLQILLNVIGISVTAVQMVMYIHRPEEALRIALFLVAQQFHLLIITLPGQVIADQSSELFTDIYCSSWYRMPISIQKTLYTIQIRSRRQCKLTAGGLYEMNIEKFGVALKTCVSYFTVLLSLSDLFQNNKSDGDTLFDFSYYQAYTKYLLFLGQYPSQSRWNAEFIVFVLVTSIITFIIPGISQTYVSILKEDVDATMESIPIIITLIACAIKLINHRIHKKNINRLLVLMKEEWDLPKDEKHTTILDEITKEGNTLGGLYRTVLLIFLMLFLCLPLCPVVLDIIIPLNETRPRQQLFKAYYFVDEDQYFYPIYIHSAWCTFVIIIITSTLDALYTLIFYHASALFAICGYRIVKVTESINEGLDGTLMEQIKQCVIMHNKALQFFEIMDDCSRNSYFLQVLLNIIGISVTAVQTVMNLDRPEEAFRMGIYLVGQQFHLLIITLPGQVIIDQSSELFTDLYCSSWYRMPINAQKMLYTMQIRSKRPCKLTAGGLYEMNIQNFGVALKTCVSYFTVLLSFGN
ncbi:PREDICTED: uncharacterized protein LOC108546969 [Eufriesea mexicana]|uniref:uncharacterized protein LOC108546969 n=1 Tax=Eufriesea mexicana TaxID=516756 RepID=UPI00083C217B|nr:PREDICTED: uncharacterized protein LOC108546969 [Eufriesea mexicana]